MGKRHLWTTNRQSVSVLSAIMEYLYVLIGIILVGLAYEYSPAFGAGLLAIIVLGMLKTATDNKLI